MTVLVNLFDRTYRLISMKDKEVQSPIFIDLSLIFRILSDIDVDLTHFEWAFTEGFLIVKNRSCFLPHILLCMMI